VGHGTEEFSYGFHASVPGVPVFALYGNRVVVISRHDVDAAISFGTRARIIAAVIFSNWNQSSSRSRSDRVGSAGGFSA
jgi:hypothetical protein